MFSLEHQIHIHREIIFVARLHLQLHTYNFLSLAHRNRSDFCDLRLRCPSRPPEIARFPRQEKAMLHCDLRVRWKVASDLSDFGLRFLSPKPLLSAGFLAIWLRQLRFSLAIAIVRFCCAEFLRASIILVDSCFLEDFRVHTLQGQNSITDIPFELLGFLVAQCSATPATEAATPPCSATPFPGTWGGGGGATPKF